MVHPSASSAVWSLALKVKKFNIIAMNLKTSHYFIAKWVVDLTWHQTETTRF